MTRPSELDWSDPHKTPREPCSRPVSGDGCPPCGRADADLSPASARPLMSARDLDDLVRSLPTAELERIMETAW